MEAVTAVLVEHIAPALVMLLKALIFIFPTALSMLLQLIRLVLETVTVLIFIPIKVRIFLFPVVL